MDVPGAQRLDEIAAHYAPQLAAAVKSSVRGVSHAISNALATSKVAAPGAHADPSGIADVLSHIYGDAWVAGERVAAEQSGLPLAGQSAVTDLTRSIDWDSWKPGNPEAALKAADGGLLELQRAANATAKDISDTTMARIGDIIAAGLIAGSGPSATAGDIHDALLDDVNEYLSDPGRAFVIANTETGRAMVAASSDQYQAQGFSGWAWIAHDGACDDCGAMEDEQPDEGYTFEVEQPPLHPSCRCSIVGAGELTVPQDVLDQIDAGLAEAATEGGGGGIGNLVGDALQIAADNSRQAEEAARVYESKAAAARDLDLIRADMTVELNAARDRARLELEQFGQKLGKPPRAVRSVNSLGQVTYSRGGRGEWDWYDKLAPEEQSRLQRHAFVVEDGGTPDQMADTLHRDGFMAGRSTDEVMEHWLEQTRIMDMVDTIENKGSLPSDRARALQFGWFDVSTLTPESPYNIEEIYAKRDLAVSYLYQLRVDTNAETTAARSLVFDLVMPPELGAGPLELSQADYVTETFRLWEAVDEIAAKDKAYAEANPGAEFGRRYTDAERADLARWEVFMPKSLVPDLDDVDPWQLWDRMQAVAKLADYQG